jgi:hypothetical protein
MERCGEQDEKLLLTRTSLAHALLAPDDPAGALPYLERIVVATEHDPAPNYARQVAALRKLVEVMRVRNFGPDVIPVLERLVRLHDHYGAETDEVAADLRNPQRLCYDRASRRKRKATWNLHRILIGAVIERPAYERPSVLRFPAQGLLAVADRHPRASLKSQMAGAVRSMWVTAGPGNVSR